MRIYCLEGLDIESLLKSEGFNDSFIKRHAFKWHYFITKLLYKRFKLPRDYRKSKVRLYTSTLTKVLGRTKSNNLPVDYKSNSPHTYLYIIIRKTLKKWGVIHYHIIYKSSKGKVLYKLLDEWDVPFKLYQKQIPEGFKKNPIDEESNKQVYGGVYQRLYESFKSITINEDAAIAHLDELLKKPSQIKLKDKRDHRGLYHTRMFDSKTYSYYRFIVENFEKLRFFYVAKDTGRIYSSVANLPSVLRQFLRTKGGKEMVELDVTNCQPLLLSKIAHVEPNYEELVREGKFYKHLKNECLKRGILVSNNFKTELFSSVFFSKNHFKKKPKLESCFETCYPEAYFSIRCIKRKNYKELSLQLQSLEAEYMINGVGKGLLDTFDSDSSIDSIATIHDSVLVPKEYQSRAEELIDEYFYN